jgi:hypothetical protein
LASMVGILFWSIYFYDASLILQPDSGYVIWGTAVGVLIVCRENYSSSLLNFYQHGIVALNMWLEVLLIPHTVR